MTKKKREELRKDQLETIELRFQRINKKVEEYWGDVNKRVAKKNAALHDIELNLAFIHEYVAELRGMQSVLNDLGIHVTIVSEYEYHITELMN